MTAALMFFMRQLARLPLPVLRALGAGVGRLLYALARKRRRIAHVNLRLCYPDWSEARVQAVARRSFVLFSQAFFDAPGCGTPRPPWCASACASPAPPKTSRAPAPWSCSPHTSTAWTPAAAP